MNENNLKDKVKKTAEQIKKVFTVYIISIVLIYIIAQVLVNQSMIDADMNQVLISSAAIIGTAIVVFYGYVVFKERQTKKLLS